MKMSRFATRCTRRCARQPNQPMLVDEVEELEEPVEDMELLRHQLVVGYPAFLHSFHNISCLRAVLS